MGKLRLREKLYDLLKFTQVGSDRTGTWAQISWLLGHRFSDYILLSIFINNFRAESTCWGSCVQCVQWWFLIGGDFPLPQGTFDNVASYFWLSQLERGLLPASSRQSLREAAKHPTEHRTVPTTENSPAQMSIVPRLQNSGLKSHRVTDKGSRLRTFQDQANPDNGAEHWPFTPIDTIICTTGTIRAGMLGGLLWSRYHCLHCLNTGRLFCRDSLNGKRLRSCLKGDAENAGASYLCSVSPEGHC